MHASDVQQDTRRGEARGRDKMIGRMMVSALALTGVAYAQTPDGQDAPAAAAPTPSSADRVVYEAAYFA
jgi:hypothetical protein